MGWERKFTAISKLENKFVKHSDINFQTCENTPRAHMYTSML
jgi:hypothetical protein